MLASGRKPRAPMTYIDGALLIVVATHSATLVASIVEAHSGRLWAARNDDAPGATITFMLPLHEPPHG